MLCGVIGWQHLRIMRLESAVRVLLKRPVAKPDPTVVSRLTELERREFLIQTLMKGSKAMGGNLLVLASQQDQTTTNIQVYGNTGGSFTNIFGSVTDTQTNAIGLTGFILRTGLPLN